MKKIYLFFMCLCFTISLFSQVDNAGFETVIDCGTNEEPPYYPYAFGDLCLGDHWECYSGSPDIRIFDVDDIYEEEDYPYGLPFEGSHFAHLATTNSPDPNALREGIYYKEFEFECGVPYNFSMAVKGFESDITFQVRASDLLFPNCGGIPDGSGGGLGQFIIESETVEASDGWVVVTVEDFFFDCDYYNGNSTNFFILPIFVNSDNEEGHFLIDAVSFEPAPCDPLVCSEKVDLTACADEGDFGYIILECAGANSYEWDFPAGSQVIDLSCGDASVILNAGEGTYSVTITGDYGCEEVREYEISPSCCVCPIPENLGCAKEHGKIKLFWDEIPDATYDITIVKNDIDCSCFWGGNEETQTITDWPFNYYYLNPVLYSCFSWTVSANCENGLESGNSLTYCYSGGECYTNEQFNGEIGHSENRRNLQTKPNVYPNPSSRDLNFELNASEELILTVEVYNFNGELVKFFPKETHRNGQYKKSWSIDEQITGGVYIVNFKTNFGTYQEKVIIQK